MQILPNLYLVNGSPFGRHQNGYLLAGSDGSSVLIDSGDLEDGECFGEVLGRMRRWGLSPDRISHLLVTHAHFDHASHAAQWRRRGVKVVASGPTAEAIRAGDDRCVGYAVHRVFEPADADVVVGDGDVLQIAGLEVRCVAAPGHAEGLMVYEVTLNGERCWFVGDLLLTQHAHRGVELGWNGGPGFDRGTYLQTLRRLKEMECDHLFPGHGPAGIGCGKRLLEKAYTAAMMKWQ